jgi:hypothetical protein
MVSIRYACILLSNMCPQSAKVFLKFYKSFSRILSCHFGASNPIPVAIPIIDEIGGDLLPVFLRKVSQVDRTTGIVLSAIFHVERDSQI